MWFDVESMPLSFTERSPRHIRNERVIDATPARVFEIFATGEAQREWFQDFVENRWTSSEPHGVGSTREVELKMLTVKERFLAWDPGSRLAFAIEGITLPIVTGMVEDLQFSPASGGGTRVVWTVHYRPSLLMRPIHPVARLIFGRLFRLSLEGLARYASAHPA
jgi:uncharacterized protein YndB with AHSA1/START domain